MAKNQIMPGLLGGLEDEEIKQQALSNAALMAGLQGLVASGPSLVPTSAGQILGQVGMTGLGAYQQSMQQAAQQKAAQQMQSVLTQGGGMPQDRQELASRYRQLGTMMASSDPAKAKIYFDIADKTEEAIEKFTGSTGNLAMAMFGTANLNKLTPEQRQAVTAEEQRQAMARSSASAAKEGPKPVIVETFNEQGQRVKVMVNPYTGEPLRQIGFAEGTKEDKLTEGQALATGFYSRMSESNKILEKLEEKGAYPSWGTAAAGSIPFIGDVAKNVAMRASGPEVQQYQQAAENWVRANLRRESGAAIGVDEMAQEIRNYFPQPGDSPAVIKQKQQARQRVTDAMRIQAGPGAKMINQAQQPVQPPINLQQAAQEELRKRGIR